MIEVVGEGRSRMGIKYFDKQTEIKEFLPGNELSRTIQFKDLWANETMVFVFARVSE